MRRLPIFALVLFTSLAAAAQDAAPCTSRPLVPVLLTPISAPMPRDGGGLVAGVRLGDAGTTSTAIAFEGVSFTRRRTSQILQVVRLAPGLVRLVPTGTLASGPWVGHGIGTDSEITVGRTALPGAPVRPSVHGMRRVAATSMSASATPRVEIRAILEFPVPTGIVAMLVYWNGETTPSTWTRAVLATTEMVVYTEPDACETVPEGTRPPPADGAFTASIAFVDQFGQVSPISTAVPVE
jgi:hypothetical protein